MSKPVALNMTVETSLRETGNLLTWLDSAFNDCDIATKDGKPHPWKVGPSIALFHQAIEHGFAIVKLFDEPSHFGSAFALVRPMFESLIRGLWLLHCATADEAQNFLEKDRIDSSLSQLIERVENQHVAFAGGYLSQIKSAAWEAMCSFAHSGARQLSRRIKGAQIVADYGDGEKLDVLRSVRLFSVLAAFEVAAFARREDLCQHLLLRLATATAV